MKLLRGYGYSLLPLLVPVLIITLSCQKENVTGQVKDVDDNVYDTLVIGSQTILKGNLRVTRYRNGDPIPNVTDATEWGLLTTGGYCDYNNDPEISKTFGRLYNWQVVNDPRGVCPIGWHIPYAEEWVTLTNYLGGFENAANKLKTRGLTSLLVGTRSINGGFDEFEILCIWWTPEGNYAFGESNAIVVSLYKYEIIIGASIETGVASTPQLSGNAILCFRD